MDKFKILSKDKIANLPKTPGVYAFKKDKEFLYIGKANNIKERVKNHFLPRRSLSEGGSVTFKDSLLTKQTKKVGYIKSDSEIEALLLESTLIKKYQPKYNIMWRDGKNYFFIEITKPARNASLAQRRCTAASGHSDAGGPARNASLARRRCTAASGHSDAGGEKFPQVFITHQVNVKNNHIGPFVDGKSLKQVLKILRKIFPYRTCKNLPKKPCLWYQLNRCPAPCLLKRQLGRQIPNFELKLQKESQQNIKNLIKILQEKKRQVLKNLKKEMEKNSLSEEFEKAGKIRDQLNSLEKVLAHAKIFEPEKLMIKDWDNVQKILQRLLKTKETISRIEAYDVSNIQGKEATGAMVTFINGKPAKNFYRKFKLNFQGKPDDLKMLKEILTRRLKHQEWPCPDLILIDGGKTQLNAAKSIIKKSVPVIAIAKKKNELFITKKPVLLKSLPREIFNLILQLRDEAHRFAISYHRKLRKKSLL